MTKNHFSGCWLLVLLLFASPLDLIVLGVASLVAWIVTKFGGEDEAV